MSDDQPEETRVPTKRRKGRANKSSTQHDRRQQQNATLTGAPSQAPRVSCYKTGRLCAACDLVSPRVKCYNIPVGRNMPACCKTGTFTDTQLKAFVSNLPRAKLPNFDALRVCERRPPVQRAAAVVRGPSIAHAVHRAASALETGRESKAQSRRKKRIAFYHYRLVPRSGFRPPSPSVPTVRSVRARASIRSAGVSDFGDSCTCASCSAQDRTHGSSKD